MNSTTIASGLRDKRRVTRFIIHLTGLGILLFLPEVMMSISAPKHDDFPTWMMYIKPLLYCVAFYLNYYVIIDRTLGRRYGLLRFVGWNTVLIVVMLVILTVMAHHFQQYRPHHHDSNLARLLSFMLRDIVVVILVIGLAVALRMSDKWRNLERKQQALQSSRQEEELKSLKSQLHPHFLFNTLNNIYALIAISPNRARMAVHDLSAMLRYVLYEDRPMVKLSDELAFIERYIKLMMLRFGDNTKVDVTIDADDADDRTIAPLLFISIVENAFKHGNTGCPDARISISVTSRDGTIVCHTSNSYSPAAAGHDTGPSGIGLSNLRRRLSLIYGDRATLDTSTETDTYDVILTINLND
ncbi:MAG: histidine kinase [Pseudoflavonifractor sp.]|nr:histidine kinase [Pseudoflavonifractor sp.]